jgi:hypothetical protein
MERKFVELPDRAFLLECFEYNMETGSLRWKVRPERHFPRLRLAKTWNTKWAGKEAGVRGFRKDNGKAIVVFVSVVCEGRRVQTSAHRLIYHIMGGIIPPKYEIDHIDHNPHNNKWDNLRCCLPHQNNANKVQFGSKLGLPKGVYIDKKVKGPKKYKAKIMVQYKGIHLGAFVTAEEAHQAYCDASNKYHREFGCTKNQYA